MQTVLIVHGSFGSPKENWFGWLKAELEKLGCKVLSPKFPTQKDQTLDNWYEIVKQQGLPDDAILVGHSIAPALLMTYLEKHKAKAAYFAAPFVHLLGNQKYDEVNITFVERNFDWDSIKMNCPTIVVYHGEDDPYVPLYMGKEIAKNLHAKLHVVKNGGHLNAEADYLEFPELLEEIKKELG